MVNILTTSVSVDGETIIKDSQGRLAIAKKVIEDFGWWSLQTIRIDQGDICFLPDKISFSMSSTGSAQKNYVGSSTLKLDTDLTGSVTIYLDNVSFSTSGDQGEIDLVLSSASNDVSFPGIGAYIFLRDKSVMLKNNQTTGDFNIETASFTQDVSSISYLTLSWDGSKSSLALGFSDGSEVTLTNASYYPSGNKLYILFGCRADGSGVNISFDITKIEINR